MAKMTWGLSAWACAIIVGVAANALIASAAQAGWGTSPEQSAAAAKKPPPPPPLQIAGTWNGTIQDSKQGTGSFSITFTEKTAKTKATLKGSWTISFLNGSDGPINDVGAMTGSVVGSAVAITLKPSRGDALGNCKLIFSSVEAAVDQISGTYHFGGCGGNNTGTITFQPGAPSNTLFVNMGDDFFFPKTLTISKGQTVRWTNNGNEEHSVNANPGTEKCKQPSGEAFDSPTIEPHTIYERTFNNSGSFPYHCEFHGCPMKGTIIVN